MPLEHSLVNEIALVLPGEIGGDNVDVLVAAAQEVHICYSNANTKRHDKPH